MTLGGGGGLPQPGGSVWPRAVDAGARILPIREEQLKERLGERFRELDVPLLVAGPSARMANWKPRLRLTIHDTGFRHPAGMTGGVE